jgi:exopolysaccharide biosynthesis protein
VAGRLEAAGIRARVEHVQSPQLADAGGDLGYRVRAGQFVSKADAAPAVAQIKAAGYASSVLYTGWDGDAGTSRTSRGPWELEVLTIDPKQFRGQLTSGFGPNLQDRETTSQLAAGAGALAATNGGYFVLDPKAGAPGDPAGTAVSNGLILSEPVGDRPSLVIDGEKSETTVQRLRWNGSISAIGKTGQVRLDGLNRFPGLIRNCGGVDDTPTSLPLHDATCTDPDEIVAFTQDFGPTTPSGPGLEVVLDEHGTVKAVNSSRGIPVPARGRTVQAIGTDVQTLGSLAKIGARLKIDAELVTEAGRPLQAGSSTDVVNGGPVLVANGAENITAKRDGMVRQGDSNSFYYGWVHKRNPRTIAGVDTQGRTLLVTADGRQTTALGLSIKESADVARSLGMVDAINLDGGGSTTMVVNGQVVNSPSDAAGQRPVGDALLVLPRRRD